MKFFFRGIDSQNPQKEITISVSGDLDPGYGSTAKMLGEAAVCLAKDELTVGGGFWTPASALAGKYLNRLTSSAGLTFKVVDSVTP